MLTRDKGQILLNEIHSLCLEASDHYHAAAANPCMADIEPILVKAAHLHQGLASELAAYIRTHDDQPKMPDPDREALGIFITNIKARLADDERRTLIADQARMEQKLCESVNAALQCNWPPALHALLENIRANATSLRQVLHGNE